MKYALESSVPKRVDRTRVEVIVKVVNVKDMGLRPKPVMKPTSIRMNIWKTAMRSAMRNIRLLNHSCIFLKPQTPMVVRASRLQRIEG